MLYGLRFTDYLISQLNLKPTTATIVTKSLGPTTRTTPTTGGTWRSVTRRSRVASPKALRSNANTHLPRGLCIWT